MLLYVYLAAVPCVFAYVLRRDRREQPWLPLLDSALLAFAAAVFWPLVAVFMLCVVGALLARDRKNGAP